MGNGLSDRKADTQELMQIRQEAYEAASQLLAAAHPKKGSILVVGCSTSEVAGEQDKQKGEGNMLTVLILIVYAIIGGVSTLAMVIGIPAVLGWKIYRKVKYQIPLMK